MQSAPSPTPRDVISFRISTNRHPGILSLESGGDAPPCATITYDSLGQAQAVSDLRLERSTGTISFTKGDQVYKGTVNAFGKISGMVNFQGKAFSWSGEKFVVDKFPVCQAWRINANNFKGLLEVQQERGQSAKGRITFDDLGAPEPLADVCLGTCNGLLHFKRPRGRQIFDGTIVNGKAAGNFVSGGSVYNWSAERIDYSGQDFKKQWTISIQSFAALLEVESAGGRCSGRITFQRIGQPEMLSDVHYNPSTGRLFFKRGAQVFDGETVNSRLSGMFAHQGKVFTWAEVATPSDAEAQPAGEASGVSKMVEQVTPATKVVDTIGRVMGSQG